MDSLSARGTNKQRYRILIVDNHPLVRRGLSSLIESETDLMVCGESTHSEGFEAIAGCQPNLITTDLWFEQADGFGLIEKIHLSYPELPVLVLSMHTDPQFARRALRAGASGYVSKQHIGKTVLIAIRRLLDGETYVSPEIKVEAHS